MSIIQSNPDTNLVWIDLEFTGFHVVTNRILQIASIITNENLDVVANGPNIIIHQSEEYISKMDRTAPVINNFFENGFIDAVRSSVVTEQMAQEETLNFIRNHVNIKKSPLCGNSVYMDRMYINTYMQELDAYLHYRLIDVSTLKTMLIKWDPNFEPYIKEEKHEAFCDIQNSIQELKYYKSKYFSFS